nr:MAG TPA: hypothetical protein [Caudoviricetes sp.]
MQKVCTFKNYSLVTKQGNRKEVSERWQRKA